MHALTTCCPQCAHCFAISIAQLQQRKGYVRCPQCASIFDGFEAVVDDTKPVPLPSALPVAAVQPTPTSAVGLPAVLTPEPSPNYEATQAARLAQDLYAPSPPLPQVFREREQFRRAEPEFTQEALVTDDTENYDAPEEGHDPQASATDQKHTVTFSAESLTNSSDFYIAPDSSHNPNHEQGFYVSGETSDASFPRFSANGQQDEPIDESEPVYTVVANGGELESETEIEPIGEHTLGAGYSANESRHADRYASYSEASVWSRLFWQLCLWALLLLLVAQAAYVYRHQLANQIPFLRPALEAVCQNLGCQISYERRAEFITISDSELHAEPDTQKNGSYRYRLALNLHNRFKRAQAWPTLVVRLQDGRGQALSAIAVPPEQYLANKGLRQSFFSADSTQRVQLNLSTPERITHYELFSYFP